MVRAWGELNPLSPFTPPPSTHTLLGKIPEVFRGRGYRIQ